MGRMIVALLPVNMIEPLLAVSDVCACGDPGSAQYPELRVAEQCSACPRLCGSEQRSTTDEIRKVWVGPFAEKHPFRTAAELK